VYDIGMNEPEFSTLPANTRAPQRRLSLFDTTCIIVGIIIGAGIYQTTPFIAANAASPFHLMLAWVLGGLMALAGAFCYAELSTTYPRNGGDFFYITRAYGQRAGFLFAWSEYWVIRPGNIGMMAFVFADYAHRLFAVYAPLALTSIEQTAMTAAAGAGSGPQWVKLLLALAAVLVLSGVNLLGLQAGKWVQNLLTVVKVLSLIAIFIAAAVTPPAGAQDIAAPLPDGFRLVTVLVLFTYGGWNEISYVAAEVRRPERNLKWALLLGVAIVMVLYCALNLAMIGVLGFQGLRDSKAVAADMLEPLLGAAGVGVMCVMVCLSCLGAANGMIFTGSRIYHALGQQHPGFRWLARWDKGASVPLTALLMQTAATLAMVAGFGWYADGFDRLLRFGAPVFWFFILMTSVALFILRFKDADRVRPSPTPLYPLLPVVFFLSTALLLHASFTYALSNRSYEIWWALLIIFIGVLISFLPHSKSS